MALEKIKELSGRGVYLPGDDVDTDRIIPARYLKCITFDGLGEFVFYDERFDDTCREKIHPLNDPLLKGAEVLVAGANFGCGSSREHAPQALFRYGIRAILAVSFAEIFFGNSVMLGMPCIVLPRKEIKRLGNALTEDPELEIAIEVATSAVRYGDHAATGGLAEGVRRSLIEGRWDPIAELLEAQDQVAKVANTLAYFSPCISPRDG